MSLDSNAEREKFQAAFPDLNFRRWEAGDYGPERMYWNAAAQATWEGWISGRSQPSEWVATSERMPELRQLVWCYAVNELDDAHVSTLRWNGTCWLNRWGAEIIDNVTHWMPLPKPPALLPPNTEAK